MTQGDSTGQNKDVKPTDPTSWQKVADVGPPRASVGGRVGSPRRRGRYGLLHPDALARRNGRNVRASFSDRPDSRGKEDG